MVVFMGNLHGEVDELESLFFSEEKGDSLKLIEIDKRFQTRLELIGGSIFSIIDFDDSQYGIGQLAMMIKGSEAARQKGLGQIVPKILTSSHSFYRPDFVSTMLDVDSYSPEKLIAIGYVATKLIPEGCTLEFFENDLNYSAEIIPFAPQEPHFDGVR